MTILVRYVEKTWLQQLMRREIHNIQKGKRNKLDRSCMPTLLLELFIQRGGGRTEDNDESNTWSNPVDGLDGGQSKDYTSDS
jgi:hypothetical protein